MVQPEGHLHQKEEGDEDNQEWSGSQENGKGMEVHGDSVLLGQIYSGSALRTKLYAYISQICITAMQ